MTQTLIWIAASMAVLLYLGMGAAVGSVANPLLKQRFPTRSDEVVFWTAVMTLLWPITLFVWWCDG